MVSVAQLVELRIVDPAVVGSSPIAHPNELGTGDGRRESLSRAISHPLALFPTRGPLAQLAEQLTLNQRVVGSSPTRPTNFI